MARMLPACLWDRRFRRPHSQQLQEQVVGGKVLETLGVDELLTILQQPSRGHINGGMLHAVEPQGSFNAL